MNRRTLITKLAAALCALPLIGKLFGQRTLASTNQQRDLFILERRAWNSPHFSLTDLRDQPDETFRCVGLLIADGVWELIRECNRDGRPIQDVSISWKNIPDPETNPNGDRGYFSVIATRRAPFKG